MKNLILPRNYKQLLNLKETEQAIQLIKNFFQMNLAFELNLMRVTAPLFVKSGTGINDDLNGVERPVRFQVKSFPDETVEIVHSLAKWKRMMLANYGFEHGEGLYTDMNAIRADEDVDNLHSLYVDQWDWEKVISPAERTLDFLIDIVNHIYGVIRRTEKYVAHQFKCIETILPDTITFIHSEELAQRYPDLSPKEREYIAAKENGAVFLIGIGDKLSDGKPHDGRAPDYDDWTTVNDAGFRGLNGDIVVYYPLLDTAFELSSMGIRVDGESLLRQLEITGQTEKKELFFQKRLLEGAWPLSIGGGIGQSRLCMFYLHKAHIGEIQTGLWPDEMVEKCHKRNIFLL